MNERKGNDIYGKKGYIFIWIGVVISALYGLALVLSKGVIINFSMPLNVDIMASIGNFLAGILGPFWALAGVMFFIDSLEMQREELRLQRLDIQLQRTDIQLQTKAMENQAKELAEMKKQYEGQRKSLEERNSEELFFKLYNNEMVNQISILGYNEVKMVVATIIELIKDDIRRSVEFIESRKQRNYEIKRPSRFISENELYNKSTRLIKLNDEVLQRKIENCYDNIYKDCEMRYSYNYLLVIIDLIERMEKEKQIKFFDILKSRLSITGSYFLIFVYSLKSVLEESDVYIPLAVNEIFVIEEEERKYSIKEQAKALEGYL